MEFKYALSILFSHIGYVIKIFVWILISLIITAAIGCAIFIPLAKVFMQTTDVGLYVQEFKTIAQLVLGGSLTARGAFSQAIPLVLDTFGTISQNVGATVGLAFGVVFLYALYSFLVGISSYTVADIINKIMASNMRFGFASAMASNFKKACRYSSARLLVMLPIDLVIGAIILAIVLGLHTYIGLLVLPIAILCAIVLCSLRATLFSAWLPRMLYHPEEKVYSNLGRSFTYVKYNVNGLFKAYVITFTLVYLLGSVFALPTGGLMFIVLPSIYYFILRAVELVGYYKTKGYNFYTDATTVVNTVEYGFRQANQQGRDEYFKTFDGDDTNM